MKNKPQSKKVLYIKLSSLDDLCRRACNFDYTNSAIMSIKSDSVYRLFSIGEEVDGIAIAYYVNSTKKETTISYNYPSSSGEPENSHFVEQPGSTQGHHYMSIININSANFKPPPPKALKKVMMIEMSAPFDMVSAVIRSAVRHESIPNIYSFQHKEKRVLCAFDAVEELSGEEDMLYYSVSSKNEPGNFARYKYSENKVDFTAYMGEHSYMYAKIINLAEPFPFFKLPD